MHDERFFDQTLSLLEAGEAPTALALLAGNLFQARALDAIWPETRAALHRHPLHAVLLEDPFAAYSVSRPRGYPGDAGLIDIIYDQQPHVEPTARGRTIFSYSINFPIAEAVRLRCAHAEFVVTQAWQAGKRILVLACGHFREGDALAGQDLTRITLVDQDPVSLGCVREKHGDRIMLHEANVFRYLRKAAADNERFDLVYTLGLTDYLDSRAMHLLHELVRKCLNPGGTFLLANFLPHHLGTGWMDAVMDWHLIYRDSTELEGYAHAVGLEPRSWHDATGSVVWCEMRDRSPDQ